MPKSNYLASKNADHNMGKAAFTMPATVYLALLTGTPSQFATGSTVSEVAYTGYARVQVLAASLNAAVNGISTNNADIAWPLCTGGTASGVGWCTVDAASGGNMLYFGSLPGAIAISNGVTPKVYANTLSIGET